MTGSSPVPRTRPPGGRIHGAAARGFSWLLPALPILVAGALFVSASPTSTAAASTVTVASSEEILLSSVRLVPLDGSTESASAWVSGEFQHGIPPSSLALLADRTVTPGPLLEAGGTARWRARLVNVTTGAEHDLADLRLTGDEGGTTLVRLPVPIELQSVGERYRIEAWTEFAGPGGGPGAAEVTISDAALEVTVDGAAVGP